MASSLRMRIRDKSEPHPPGPFQLLHAVLSIVQGKKEAYFVSSSTTIERCYEPGGQRRIPGAVSRLAAQMD